MKRYLLILLCSLIPQIAMAGSPNCSTIDGWVSNMAFAHLKNAGILHSETTDFAQTKIIRLASEKLKPDLYRQVHQITFTEKSGRTVAVITVNDASHEECSIGGVEVFEISRQLGGLNQ